VRRARAKPPFVFRAKLVRMGAWYIVDAPAALSKAVGVRGFVPVAGTANGAAFRASLLPRGGGRHSIALNAAVRAAGKIVPGRLVSVELRVDTEPRGGPTPEDVADALRAEGVLEAFESLAPGRKMHILQWLDAAVHEETRARRVARVVEVALAQHEKRLDRGSASES